MSKEFPHRPVLLDFGLTKSLPIATKQALAKMLLASAEVSVFFFFFLGLCFAGCVLCRYFFFCTKVFLDTWEDHCNLQPLLDGY